MIIACNKTDQDISVLTQANWTRNLQKKQQVTISTVELKYL